MTTLKNAKMPSLRDKIEAKAVVVKVKVEKSKEKGKKK